jgi:hypothetical protein
VLASARAIREIQAEGERTALSAGTPAQRGVSNPPEPPPSSTRHVATRQPPYTATNSSEPAPPPIPRPSTRPPRVLDAPFKSTGAPAAGAQKPATSPHGPSAPSAPPPAPQTQNPVVPPLPTRPAGTPAPPSTLVTPTSAPSPQPAPQPSVPVAGVAPAAPPLAVQASQPASVPQATAPPTGLFTIRIGPVSDDRATAIANQLLGAGFSGARLGTETGYRVISEPFARDAAENLISTLGARGIRSYIGPMTGETVQIVFGVFASLKDAEALSNRIAVAGYDAWVRAGTVYTLHLGPYPSSAVNTITEMVKTGDPQAAVVADPVSQP